MEQLIEQFLEHLRYERNVSAHTLRNYSSDLEQFLDHLAPADQKTGKRKLPEIKNRLATDGTELVTDSPEEFSNYLKAEANRWARVIKDAGINAD